MIHEIEVDFRGGKREVEFEYEGDGVIVWNFKGDDVCFGADATEAERDAVYQQLWACLVDWWAWEPEP